VFWKHGLPLTLVEAKIMPLRREGIIQFPSSLSSISAPLSRIFFEPDEQVSREN
jgi:hypothetical protein